MSVKEIFVIDSFITNKKQLNMLEMLVDYLWNFNAHICLVSHKPIPVDFVEKSKYTIYDSNNIIGNDKIELYFTTLDNKLDIRWNPDNGYHGLAVYHSIYNSLKLLKDLYSWVHFVEYDVNIFSIDKYLEEFNKFKKDYDVLGQQFSSTGIVTNLFSIRPEIELPKITTWEEYKVQYDNIVLENCFLKMLVRANARIKFIDSIPLGNNQSEGDFSIVCANCNTGKMVFIINRCEKQLCTMMNKKITILGKFNYSCQYFPDSCGVFSIFDGNDRKEYEVSNLKVNGRFKFFDTDNKLKCPDYV